MPRDWLPGDGAVQLTKIDLSAGTALSTLWILSGVSYQATVLLGTDSLLAGMPPAYPWL